MKRKILLLGRAGIGKSSIRKVIFEGAQPQGLLDTPLEPTRGISPENYKWLDLDLGVFDTSGQELSHLLIDKKEHDLAFKNTDSVIYIFDYNIWKKEKSSVINDINKIKEIIKESYRETRLVLILHKIDLITEDNKESELNLIQSQIQEEINLPLYLTSLFPDMIYSVYNAIYQILSTLSEETYNLKVIIDNKLEKIQETLCYVTDQNNSIVVQSMTPDFDISLINYSHNLTAQLNILYEEMTHNDNIEHVIITSSNKLNLILKKLNIKKYNFKNIICVSKDLTANKLILLIGELRRTYNQYIFQGKYKLDD